MLSDKADPKERRGFMLTGQSRGGTEDGRRTPRSLHVSGQHQGEGEGFGEGEGDLLLDLLTERIRKTVHNRGEDRETAAVVV